MQSLPPPAFNGTYEDSCLVCLQGTDAALDFRGDAEWMVAGLTVLGIGYDEVASMISRAHGCDVGLVPKDLLTMTFRVCESCVTKSGTGMTVGLVDAQQVPIYQHT
jgi:hypothetical protein